MLRRCLIALCLWPGLSLAAPDPLALVGIDKSRLDVEVIGGSPALADNIRAHIGSLEERDAKALRRFRNNAETLAIQAVQALGYYQSSVRSEVSGQDDKARLKLIVEAGEPVRLRTVDIRIEGEAAQMPAFVVPQSGQLKPGAVLDQSVYDDARKLISNQALQYGYFDGQFLQRELRVDPDDNVADIFLVWDSGPRYHFGAVSFAGDLPVGQPLLDRLQPIKEGEHYNSDRLGELNRTLQAAGYFREIQIDAGPERAVERRIPVLVTLNKREPRSLGAGIGFSTDVGPRLRGTFTRHYRGKAGHSYGSEFELSSPRQNLGAWYQVPLQNPLVDSLRFTAGYQHEDLVDTNSTLYTLGSQWQTTLDNQWQRIVSLRLEQEDYTLADETGSSAMLLPGIAFNRTVSDSKIDPSNGWMLNAELTGASTALLSDANLMWAKVEGKRLHTFDNGHRVLLRGQLGSLATDDFSAIPPSLRFFTGGDQSVRGFEYQTLSPLDAHDEHVGGRNLVVGSLEYQYPLLKKWRLAAFVDHGNAIDSLSDPLRTGVGLGVRWVSPVGPLRFDIAQGLSDSYGDGGWRVHFSMGPEL